MKLLITTALTLFTTSAFANTVVLQSGESITIGGTDVVCQGGGTGHQYSSTVDLPCVEEMSEGVGFPRLSQVIQWAAECRTMDITQMGCIISGRVNNTSCSSKLAEMVSGFLSQNEKLQIMQACKDFTLSCRF